MACRTSAKKENVLKEYIVITVSSGSVSSIAPVTPQTESARSGGAFGDLGSVLTKMAEYGYELVPGILMPMNAVTYCLIMGRRND